MIRALYCGSSNSEFLKSSSAASIRASRELFVRSQMSWHDWHTLVLESLIEKDSVLQLMQAPGCVVSQGMRWLHLSQICGRDVCIGMWGGGL